VLGPARVSSILITTETRPYMREGEAVRAFPLSPAPRWSASRKRYLVQRPSAAKL